MALGFIQLFDSHVVNFAQESFAANFKLGVFELKGSLLGHVAAVNGVKDGVHVEVFGVEDCLCEVVLTT